MTASLHEQVPEALRLADEWRRETQREVDRRNSAYDHYGMGSTPETLDPLGAKMAAELRRQHAENEALRDGYNAARLEIESLKTQIIPGVQWQCGPLASGFTATHPATKSPADSHPTPENLRALFREALAWGMVYGPEIPAHQWDEMRESMVKQYTERASHGQAPAVANALAATLLRKMEWDEVRHEYRDSQYFCPVCDADKRDGHIAECELAAVLKATDEQSAPTTQADSQPAPVRDYPPLPNFDSGDEPIWNAIFNWKTATPGPDAHRKANAIESAIIDQLRAYVDADRAARAPADSVTAPAGERENLALRRMLCVAHAGAAAYMDDGEAQDSRELPIIDFLRDTPDEIQDKLQKRMLNKLTDGAARAQVDAARHFFDAGWKACANFCDRDDVRFDGIVGHRGCPQFEEAFRAALKQGGV